MNGSRSNTQNYSSKSSLDQLNRTIEGLEARIQGLMGEKVQARQASANPVDEIVERQRLLGTTRERVSAVMGRHPEPQTRAQPGWSDPAPRATAADPALGEIAATLSALRAELKYGLGDGLGDIRNEMRNIKSVAATTVGGVDSVRQDLAQLGHSLEKLESSGRNVDTGHLRADLDELRTLLGGIAREDTLHQLEKRWDATEKTIAGFNPDALKEELVQLAWRIDGLKSGLGEMSTAPAVRVLEDKLMAVATAIEMMGRNMQAQNNHADQFAGLDHRLDEISRAIAAGARQGSSVLDSSALQRLEGRINDLVDHIGALPQANPTDDMAERIEALTARIEEMTNEEAARKLEDRIAQLSGLIERNFRESATPVGLTGHLEDISRKIDGLGGSHAENLIARLDALSRKMDEVEYPAIAAPLAATDTVSMSRLETRLADIAARLDESAAAPATDAGAMKNLEKQIANLSALLDQPGTALSSANLPDDFGHRMNAIEDYIASSDEFIVEAARQAAETVVEAYSRNGFAANTAGAADVSALSGLAEDLRALETYTRSSEERTQATFEALHQTLVQIAGRLNDIGASATPADRIVERMSQDHATQERKTSEPARETRERLMETVAMPKASQPDFADAQTNFEEPAFRRAPENARVAVFDEADLMPAGDRPAEDTVSSDAAPMAAQKEIKASKSLIAGLAARLRPAKKDKPVTTEPRLAVDPAPALDPGPAVVAEDTNLLLEPGSGVPDVKKILEKVRNGQLNTRRDATPANGQNDVIAAARRAAQAAAAEAGSQKFVQPSGFKKDKEKTASKSLFAGAGSNRRPILLAAAAILLVVMSYPLVSNLIGGRSAQAPVDTQERSLIVPAEKNLAVTADKPAAAAEEVTPIEAEKPTQDASIPADDIAPQETATDKMMQSADNADNTTLLEKPADQQPQTVVADPAKDATAPVDTTEAIPAAKDPKAIAPVVTDAAPEVEIPAGLKPASLVEAVKKGDALAYFEIGARYTDGRGTKVDLAEAAKWYKLSADKGSATAQYRLANFYEKGTGVTRDMEKAKALYTASAEKGNASAMHNLAVLYATGVGGTPDFNQAAHWFQEAAEYNVRDSQFNLAILYARGNGVAQDLEESYKWFAVAAREGDQDAGQKRDEVANAMSPEQLKNAKAKLDLWKPRALNDAANTPMVPDEWIAKGNTTATVDMKRAIRNIQAILNNNGFDAGRPDGEMGKKTVTAIKAFQKAVGQDPTGQINDALVKELLARNKKS